MRKRKASSIVLFVLGILFMLPVFILVMNSFKTYDEVIKSFVTLPESLYLGNFAEAARLMNYGVAVRNSLFVTICTVIVCTVISFFASFGISHLKGKKQTGFYLLFSLGQIIPFHTIMIALSVMMTNLNMNNSLITLIILYSGFHRFPLCFRNLHIFRISQDGTAFTGGGCHHRRMRHSETDLADLFPSCSADYGHDCRAVLPLDME